MDEVNHGHTHMLSLPCNTKCPKWEEAKKSAEYVEGYAAGRQDALREMGPPDGYVFAPVGTVSIDPAGQGVLLVWGDKSLTYCFDNDHGPVSFGDTHELLRRLMVTRLRYIADAIELTYTHDGSELS